MGKKPTPKTKAKAAPAPVVEEPESAERLEAKRLWQQRRDASKWVQAQLTVVRAQYAAAKGTDWLQVAHEFHEIRLIRTAKKLDEKTIEGLPDSLKEGLDTYVKQCVGEAQVEEATFNFAKELWDCLESEGAQYTRAEESSDALAIVEKLKVWTGISAKEIGEYCELMLSQPSSPAVQEAALTRIGFLFSEAQRAATEAPEGAPAPDHGLTVAAVYPALEAGMRGLIVDPDVQRAGLGALRGLALMEGELPALFDSGGAELAVAGLLTHYKVKDVCQTANGAFWAMAKAAGRNSPEISRMRTAGVTDVLLKVMNHHAWDQTLCGKIRVTLPFITED